MGTWNATDLVEGQLLYFTMGLATTTLTTAGVITTNGNNTAANTNRTSLVGTATGWGEMYTLSNAAAWAAAGSIGTPSGNGWLYDTKGLEGQTVLPGAWTPQLKIACSANTCTATITIRAYIRSKTGGYTAIGSTTLSGQAIGAASTIYAPPAFTGSAVTFGTGDKLYFDCWLNITATTMVAGATLRISSSATLPTTIDTSVTLPGLDPTNTGVLAFTLGESFADTALSPVDSIVNSGVMGATGTTAFTTYFLVGQATTTLTTASKLITLFGSSSNPTTQLTTPLHGTDIGTGWGELWSLSNSKAWEAKASIPVPSGHGWLYDSTALEGMTFAAGNWMPYLHLVVGGIAANTITTNIAVRMYIYHSLSSTYTLIGQSTASNITVTATDAQFNLTAVNCAAASFLQGDKFYVDVWENPSAHGGGGTLNDTAIYGNTGTTGSSNAQITTPGIPAIPIGDTLSAPADTVAWTVNWGDLTATNPLTVYLDVNTTAAPLSTASQLAAANTNGTLSSAGTPCPSASANGWGEMYAKGTSNSWPNLVSLGNPSGNGWYFDSYALENTKIVAGTWTATIRLGTDFNGCNVNAVMRFYKYTAGVYTAIGLTPTSGTLNFSSGAGVATFTLPAASLSAMTFNAGDRLYVDLWIYSIGNPISELYVFGATNGAGNSAAKVVTPGVVWLGPPGFDVLTEAEQIAQTAWESWSDQGTLTDGTPFPNTTAWSLGDAVTVQDGDGSHWASANVALEDDTAAPVDALVWFNPTVTLSTTWTDTLSPNDNASAWSVLWAAIDVALATPDVLAVATLQTWNADSVGTTDTLSQAATWGAPPETTLLADALLQGGALTAPTETVSALDGLADLGILAWASDALISADAQASTLGITWGIDILALLADRQDSAGNWGGLDGVMLADTSMAAAALSATDLALPITEMGPWPASQIQVWLLADTTLVAGASMSSAAALGLVEAAPATDALAQQSTTANVEGLGAPLDTWRGDATQSANDIAPPLDVLAALAALTGIDASSISVEAVLANAALGLGDSLSFTADTLAWHNPVVYLTGTDLNAIVDALGSAAGLFASEGVTAAATITLSVVATPPGGTALPVDAPSFAARQDATETTAGADTVVWAGGPQWGGAQLASDVLAAAAALDAGGDVLLSQSSGAWAPALVSGDGSTLADILALAATLQRQDTTAPSDASLVGALTRLGDTLSLADQAARLLTLFTGDAVTVSDATAAAATGLWLERITTNDGVALYAWLLWRDVGLAPGDGAGYRLTPLLVIQVVALARDGRMSVVGRDGVADARARDGQQAAQEE